MRNKSRHKKPNQKSGHNKRSKPHSGRLQLYGIHTVIEALENDERVKHRLLVTKNASQRLSKQIARMEKTLDIFEAQPSDIDAIAGRDAVHQGVLLECDPLPAKTIDDIDPGSLVVVLDQISDPHNVGAIMRSCVAMGAGALITTSRSSAPQSATLAKSASGALDLIDLVEVGNLSKAIDSLNAQGYQSIGLDSEGPDILENTVDCQRPTVLVLGAEGKGLRHKTRETCTVLARLDMPGKIKSLNVSNAAALALYVITNR